MRIRWTIALLALTACSMKSADKAENANQTVPARNTGAKGSGSGPGGDGVGRGRGRFEIMLDGEFEAVGAVDKGAVRKVVKDNVTKLQTCYEQTLMANPDIAGTVTATFTIDNGSVTNVKASGVHPDVELCVIKAVQLFKFPPGGKVDVSYPFTFKPAS